MRQQGKAAIWEQAPMMRFLAALLVGILVYDAFAPKGLQARFVLIGLALCIVPFVLLSLKNKRGLSSILLGYISTIALGFSLCYYQDCSQKNEFLGRKLVPNTYSLAVITAEPINKNKTTKYEVSILKTLDRNQIKDAVGKAYLYVLKGGKEQKIAKGDTLFIPSNWQSMSNSGNPFALNYQKSCARKGIYFQQFLTPDKVVVYAARNQSSFNLLEKTYKYAINSIQQHIKDSSTSALLKAMLLGDERDIDPTMREAYSDTGTIHIISISGAHVAILFATIAALFKGVNNKKKKWIQLLLSLGLVWFYVLLSGASTPALRAALMFSILAIGAASQQQTNPLNQLLTAAFVLLLLNPMWLFTIGFQLSFITVLSLIIFYPPLLTLLPQAQLKGKSKVLAILNYGSTFLLNALAASIAAEILVAPLVAFYFHSFPPMFLIANILASIAMTAVLILGMLLLLVAKISLLAQALSSIIIFIAQIFHKWIAYLQQINLPAFKTIHLSPQNLVLLYLIILAFASFWLLKNKQSLWIGLFAMLGFSLQHLHKSLRISQQNGLVVYHQNGAALIEKYCGNTFEIINGDSEETFAQKNAHIGLNLQHKKSPKPQATYIIKGQKIAVLRDEAILPNTFPVDILIVAYETQKVDVANLQKIFRPKKIVIGNNQKAYQIKDWEAQCAGLEIALHNTKKDGAFLLP